MLGRPVDALFASQGGRSTSGSGEQMNATSGIKASGESGKAERRLQKWRDCVVSGAVSYF